jgi:DNA-binding beta-propeller fold protein YncE
MHLIAFLITAGCTHGGSDDGMAPPFTDGVSTLAGAAEAGNVDGDRDMARFRNPVNVAVGPDGRVYVADWDNNKIRVVTDDGTTSTLIAQPGFARPFGLAFSGSTLWVTTDSNNHGAHVPKVTGSVWRVDIGQKTAVEIADSIGMPRSIAPLKDGRFAVADYENHVIDIVDAHGGVTLLAGQKGVAGFADGAGAAAAFSTPYGIVQRADGKLIVCDFDNNRLRVVGLDGSVSTLAGTGTAGFSDGAMAGAMFHHPQGLSIASNGDLFVTDIDNFRVRRIVGSTIDTIAGDGKSGYSDQDDSLSAEFQGLEGVAVKLDGSMVYVADGTRGTSIQSNRVRQVKMSQ